MLETREITKRYGAVLVNDRLSLSILPGEVVGLLGENGAGKSTLLSVLSGMVKPDDGYLMLDGKRAAIHSPGDALRLGIGTVYQHFSLVPVLTVREQLRLAGWRSSQLPALLQNTITGSERIDMLSPGERQRVEISKALISSPRFLLLDEPTSILTPGEIVQLFEVLRAIRDQGTSIVLVTHKLDEAVALSDRIVVLRQGALAGSAERAGSGWESGTKERLLDLMFGTTADQEAVVSDDPAAARPGRVPVSIAGEPDRMNEALFSVRHVSVHGRGDGRAIRDVSLEVPAGMIGAIVGIDGQGQRELAEVLTGYRSAEGEITLSGRSLAGTSARVFSHAGIGYLTGDRQREGGVAGMSVAMNLMLKRQRQRQFSRGGILRQKVIAAEARRLVAAWSIAPRDISTPLELLSGGNIQKVLLARELAMSALVLVANNPTSGLDAKTQAIVWQAMREITRRNGGVLFFTTDIEEALAQSDQVAVISNGQVSPFVPSYATDRLALANMMASGW